MQCIYLSVKLIDSFFMVSKKYYPHTLSGECRYSLKKIKIVNNEQLNLSKFNDKSDNEADNECEKCDKYGKFAKLDEENYVD